MRRTAYNIATLLCEMLLAVYLCISPLDVSWIHFSFQSAILLYTARPRRCVLSPVHTVSQRCDCRTKVRLSHKSETVAENGDCRRIRRQSHFSATVWTGYKIPAALLAFRVAQNVRFFGPRTVSVTRDQTIVLRT